MYLPVSGHPLHTRAMSVTLWRRDDAKLVALGTVLDLRKHGFVPVGGDLQPSGVIHDMRIEALIDARTRIVEKAQAAMPAVAFEPAPATRGESCRDVAGKIAALAGLALDADYVRRVREEFAGPLGCSHLLTLAQLLGTTVAHALDTASGAAMDWARGGARRLFCRSLSVDGHETDAAEIQLAAQLADLYLGDAPAVVNPMRRFVRCDEVRVLARLDPRTLCCVELRAGERTRSAQSLADAVWRPRPEAAVALGATPLLGGFLGAAARHFGAGADRPLCDLLQSLPGALLQVMGARSETWPRRVAGADTVVGIGGTPDSCYMWRSDGALHDGRKATDPQPRL